MASTVFANNREISCKAADGKTICAMPDVCFTPPENPATPPGVPVPYPNTGMASDTTNGSKSVKIGGKEVGLKDESYFKKSIGDEAGCAAKKGVITSTNTGKVYFKSWSMDVKIEGENAVRHLDLTTNNHASGLGDTPPWIYTDRVAIAGKMETCADERQALEDNNCHKKKDGKVKCPDSSKVDEALDERASFAVGSPQRAKAQKKLNKAHMEYEKACRRSPCNKAAACMLVTYEDGEKGACCKPQTPHHLVFDAALDAFRGKGKKEYSHAKGPCICAAGNASNGIHGLLHGKQKQWINSLPSKKTTVGEWESAAAKTVEKVHPQCKAACIKAQLRKAHKNAGVPASAEVETVQAGAATDAVPALQQAWSAYR